MRNRCITSRILIRYALDTAAGVLQGDVVATAMGGMGRDFDGGYAEYTCVPAKQVQVGVLGLDRLPHMRTLQCVRSKIMCSPVVETAGKPWP